MKTIVLASIVALALGGTAFAQMCGGGAMQQSSTTAQVRGMSCMGGMMHQVQADDPMADKSTDKPKAAGMMCPCCKNMAMMGGMQGQGGDAMPKHENMPMTPKQ